MPIQAPQWTDYLNCPVCCREFGPPPRSPVSLGCGHTLCRQCLNHLHKKQCPYDQTVIHSDPDDLVVNTALLQLAGYSPPAQPYHPPCIQALPERDQLAYDSIVQCMEHLAIYLKYNGNGGNNLLGSRLSRPMQRKLVTLLQCAITDEEGRGRMARAARSLGERTVTELILQHQNPQQISAYLWAAVRARGCQFLGPAMQEEVLKLVLLALDDGSALSRKVLVMFVVQRLKPHFPQASKTSIGHVVQLLYRASCFKVSKRESDSSLMQLKEEFRTYDSLRREHDAQIVQIATESGLRIAPDQWSALLYGDTAHKSHMQSIIDKLQTPQSFSQSVQELFIALHRTGDPAQLIVMSMHLERLASIDASPDAKGPSWQLLAELMTSLKEVVSGLSHHLQQQNRDPNHSQKHLIVDRTDSSTSQPSPQNTNIPQFDGSRPYRVNDDEIERYQWPQPPNQHPVLNGNVYHNMLPPAQVPQNMTQYDNPPQNMTQPIESFNGNGAQNMPRPQMPLPYPVYYGYAIPIPVRFAGMPGVGGPSVPPPNNGDMCHDIMRSQHFVPIPDQIGPPRFHGGMNEEQAKIAYAQSARYQGAVLPHMPFEGQETSSSHGMPIMRPQVTCSSPYMMEEGAKGAVPPPASNGEQRHALYNHDTIISGNTTLAVGSHEEQPTYAQKAAVRRPESEPSLFKRQKLPLGPVMANMETQNTSNTSYAAKDGKSPTAGLPGSNGEKQFKPIPDLVGYSIQRYPAGLQQQDTGFNSPKNPFQRQNASNMQYHGQETLPNIGQMNLTVPNNSPYSVDEMQTDLLPEYKHIGPVYEPRQELAWSQNNNVFNFNAMREVLSNNQATPITSNGIFHTAVRRPLSNLTQFQHAADDQELEEELLALEQRISTEFKSTD